MYIAMMFVASLMEMHPLVCKSYGYSVHPIPSVRNKFVVQNCHKRMSD